MTLFLRVVAVKMNSRSMHCVAFGSRWSSSSPSNLGSPMNESLVAWRGFEY